MSQKMICGKCHNTFDEDELEPVYQWDGEGVMGGYHAVEDKCPHCGSTDYLYDARECCVCGEDFAEDDMVESEGDWYCKECARRVYEAYWLKYGRHEEREGHDGNIV